METHEPPQGPLAFASTSVAEPPTICPKPALCLFSCSSCKAILETERIFFLEDEAYCQDCCPYLHLGVASWTSPARSTSPAAYPFHFKSRPIPIRTRESPIGDSRARTGSSSSLDSLEHAPLWPRAGDRSDEWFFPLDADDSSSASSDDEADDGYETDDSLIQFTDAPGLLATSPPAPPRKSHAGKEHPDSPTSVLGPLEDLAIEDTAAPRGRRVDSFP